MSNDTGLRKYMGTSRRLTLGNKPTDHGVCKQLFGVMRPGKTARDKAKRGRVYE